MLSKIALLILGLISKKSLNPYEIKKLFEGLELKNVFPMSSSSIYATINALVKKGYISGKKSKDGNMPEKTIYSITKTGEEALKKTLITYLSEIENIFSEFDISITHVCYLSKEEALESLENHRVAIKEEIAEIKRQYNKWKKDEIPYPGLIRRKHNIHKREAEQKTIKELIKHIDQDNNWMYYPALEL